MKNIVLTAIVLGILVYVIMAGCSKSSSGNSACVDQPVTTDSSALLSFATINGIAPVKDATGLYYQVLSQGYGSVAPTANSIVSVTYLGTRMDAVVFDSTGTTARNFTLGNLIPGWQIGLPKIRAGGHIQLLVPSSLAYGCVGVTNSKPPIPPNSPIYFDITLVSVQ